MMLDCFIRPVTNEKPDSDLAEDINVLSQNFKQKNKYRQTVGNQSKLFGVWLQQLLSSGNVLSHHAPSSGEASQVVINKKDLFRILIHVFRTYLRRPAIVHIGSVGRPVERVEQVNLLSKS